MTALVLADVDDLHWRHGPGSAEILLSCGDVSESVLREAAQAYHCQQIFAVKGNHDADEGFSDAIVDLHLQVVEYGGLRFGGLNGSWRYKPRGPFLYERDEVARFLRTYPPVDVLVTHNSPSGIHDRQDGIHVGFDALVHYIERAQPRLVFHGHQHHNAETQVGGTRIIGIYGHRRVRLLIPA